VGRLGTLVGVAGEDFVPRPGTWPTDSGTAELVADGSRPGAYLLAVNGVAQSYVDLVDPTTLEFAYIRRLADLVDARFPVAERVAMLHVGGGAGTLARYVATTRPGSPQTVVDVDAVLVAGVLARLGDPPFRYQVQDGRQVLTEAAASSVDVVVTDAFVGSSVPSRLTTVEYLGAVRGALRRGGVYAVNVADGGELAYLRRILATVVASFTSVLLVAEPAVLRGRRFGNAIVVGSDQELPVAGLVRAAAGDAAAPGRVVVGPDLTTLIGDAMVLTDAKPLVSPIPPPGSWAVH
jgi:hypothetical protein